MLFFDLIGVIADVDATSVDNPCHPSPVLLLEVDDEIARIVVPRAAWQGPGEVLQVGRVVRVAGQVDFFPKPGSLPVAFHFELADLN